MGLERTSCPILQNLHKIFNSWSALFSETSSNKTGTMFTENILTIESSQMRGLMLVLPQNSQCWFCVDHQEFCNMSENPWQISALLWSVRKDARCEVRGSSLHNRNLYINQNFSGPVNLPAPNLSSVSWARNVFVKPQDRCIRFEMRRDKLSNTETFSNCSSCDHRISGSTCQDRFNKRSSSVFCKKDCAMGCCLMKIFFVPEKNARIVPRVGAEKSWWLWLVLWRQTGAWRTTRAHKVKFSSFPLEFIADLVSSLIQWWVPITTEKENSSCQQQSVLHRVSFFWNKSSIIYQ